MQLSRRNADAYGFIAVVEPSGFEIRRIRVSAAYSPSDYDVMISELMKHGCHVDVHFRAVATVAVAPEKLGVFEIALVALELEDTVIQEADWVANT